MKIVYFGFDLFADCFRTILETKSVEVMALYTFKTDDVFEFNCEVVNLAKKHNIPVFYHKITAEELNRYFDKGCDFTLSAGYIYKIPVLERPDFKGINIHPALLPVGRGVWPYPCTILRGLKKSGVTIHKIEKSFDTGDILLQKEYNLTDSETLDSLTLKSQYAATELLKNILADFDNLWKKALPQGEGEYFIEPNDADRTITTDMTVAEAELIIRAFGSYGVIFKGEQFLGKTKKQKTVTLKNGNIKLYY